MKSNFVIEIVLKAVIALFIILFQFDQSESIRLFKTNISKTHFKERSAYFSTFESVLIRQSIEKHERNKHLELMKFYRNSSFSVTPSFLSSLKQKYRKDSQFLKENQNLKDYVTCQTDLFTYLLALNKTEQWAMQMADATAKPGAGLARQNLRFLGDFDECLATQTRQEFGPDFCLVTAGISLNDTRVYIQAGLCVPDSCGEQDLQEAIQQYLDTTFGNDTIVVAKIDCYDKDLPLTNHAKIAIVVLSVIAAFMVLGTLYDLLLVQRIFSWMCSEDDDVPLEKQKLKDHDSLHRSEYEPLIKKPSTQNLSVLGRALMAFSVYTNTSKLLSTASSSGNIDCIVGIRFFSMTWVVLGHSIINALSSMDNVYPYLEMSYKRWTFQVIANALVSVDTFFALSGLLTMYLVMKQLQKTGPYPAFFGQMYFHRFWRLTPPYMLVLMTWVTLFKYVSDGPGWPQKGPEVNDCEDTWWTNLLYVNNIVKSGSQEMCMGWTWYLANDMQFFVISPIIFLPVHYLGVIGLVIPLILLVGNAMASGIITQEYNLSPNLDIFGDGTGDYFDLYYIKPYTRIGPYIVGMVTGYSLYRNGCKARLSKMTVFLGWILAASVALAVQYGLFEHENGHPVTSEVAALYNALHRIGWAVAVCWVIYACANGYGGFVNNLLSWKALVPLSRLTYCVYLVHPMVIFFHYSSQRRPVYLDNNNVAFSFVSILVIAYLVGYVASMAFEAPMIGLEKALKKQKS